MENIAEIINRNDYTKDDIICLLNSNDIEMLYLFREAYKSKVLNVDKKTYFRGLIEYSNQCGKNCLYCGIRKDNTILDRYELTLEEVLDAAIFAHKNKYASIVLQSGEFQGEQFTQKIEKIIKEIHVATDNELGITLSMGEQSEDTYLRWRKAGAKRYLLRIETTNKELYQKIHPNNKHHSFEKRIESLHLLKECDYQVGTGVMIGLPGQTIENLADDLLFMKEIDIDMCGMGPYLPHKDTPMYEFRETLIDEKLRRDLTFKMIAILRLMMPDINIAATTALQAIDNFARETALKCGANVMMPNVTPAVYRDDYKLYDNKPCTNESADDCVSCMEVRLAIVGDEIGYNQHGDSLHYRRRKGFI